MKTTKTDLGLEKSKKEISKFIAEKEFDISDIEWQISECKKKTPLNIGELLGLMNKLDLSKRSLTQVSGLKKELYGR